MVRRIAQRRVGSIVVVAVTLLSASCASAATLPKAVDFWGMPPDGLGVRPSELLWVTDVPNGAGSFNGPGGSSTGGPRGPHSNISWSSWTASGATGTGDVWVSHNNSNGGATYTPYPANVILSVPQTEDFLTTLNGGSERPALVFTQMEVSFTAAVPAGWRRSEAFALKFSSKGFSFFPVPN